MNINQLNIDGLRIEIAVLQENVPSNNPGTAKFKIPVIMTEDTVSHITAYGNNNIVNKKNANMNGYSINIEDSIDLRIPTEYTYFYGKKIVPAGTRFLVVFVGGNINDIRIIGRYDYNKDGDIPYSEI